MENSPVFRLLIDPKYSLSRNYQVLFTIKVKRIVADKPEDRYGIYVFLHDRDNSISPTPVFSGTTARSLRSSKP